MDMETNSGMMNLALTARGTPRVRDVAMEPVPPAVIARMQQLREASDGVPVMQQLGISDNTWRKVRAGEPLRRSVFLRLMERFGA